MKRCLLYLGLAFFFALLVVGCGGKEESGATAASMEEKERAGTAGKEAMPPAEEMKKAVKEMERTAGEGKAVEPVDFRSLKSLLPEKLGGMNRIDASGQRTGAFGMKMSMAQGEYEAASEGDAAITVTITDLGSLRGPARMGYAAWLNMEFDRETEEGYERTTKVKGYPAFESFEDDGSYKSGTLAVFVGGRYMVNIDGDEVEMEALKAALEAIDLDKLSALK